MTRFPSAREPAGVSETQALVGEGLKALIERESARWRFANNVIPGRSEAGRREDPPSPSPARGG